MALFLNDVDNFHLIRTMVLPVKTKTLDRDIFLYIPTLDRDDMSKVVDKLTSNSNFRIRYIRAVYTPNKFSAKIGTTKIPYMSKTTRQVTKYWRDRGLNYSYTTETSVKGMNAILDIIDFYIDKKAKIHPNRMYVITLWESLLMNIPYEEYNKYIIITPEVVKNNYVTSGSILMDVWTSLDFYDVLMYLLKYNTYNFLTMLKNKGITLVWTDYKSTFKIDPQDEKLFDLKPNRILSSIFSNIRFMKFGKPLDKKDEDDEAIDKEVASTKEKLQIDNSDLLDNLDKLKNTNTKAMDDMYEEINQNLIEHSLKVGLSPESIKSIEDVLEITKTADIDTYVKSIMTILEKSELKNDYIPPRLAQVAKKQKEIVNRSLADTAELVEEKKDMILDEKSIPVETPHFNEFRVANMESQYTEKQEKEDRINCLSNFSKGDVPLFLTNYKEKDNKSSVDNKVKNISVTFSTPDLHKESFTFNFNLPKIEDNKLYLGNSQKSIIKEKISLPIIKIKDRVVFTTYYNKLFLMQKGNSLSKKNHKIKKFIKTLRERYNNDKDIEIFDFTPVIHITSKNNNYSEELVEMSSLFSKLYIDDDNYIDLSTGTTFVGKLKGVSFYANNADDNLYDEDQNITTDLLTIFNALISSNNYSFSDLWKRIYKEKITVKTAYAIVSAARADKDVLSVILVGNNYNLKEILDKLKSEYDLQYKIIPHKNNKIPRDNSTDNVDDFIFKTFTLRVKYNNLSNRTLLSVLHEYNLKSLDSLNLQEVIEPTIPDNKRVDLINLHNLFIDPITAKVMEDLSMPTNFIDALIYANALLFNYDRTIDDVSLELERMPSNTEIIQGTMYKVLAQEYANYVKKCKNGDKFKFTISPNAIINKLQESTSVSEASILNPVHTFVKNNTVSSKGLEGLGVNSDRAYKLEKRTWDRSFYGVMSSVSPYNKGTGVNKQLVVNPNIDTVRGYFNNSKDVNELDPSETMAMTEALGTFTHIHDSAPRTAMAMQQFTHMIPVDDAEPNLVTYGMDESLSYLDNEFVIRAEDDGIVKAVNDKFIKIKYPNDEKTYGFNLIVRNSEKSFFMSNDMIIKKYKVGDKVHKNDLIAYNKRMYEDVDDNLIFKVGPLAYVAVMHTQNSYEDAVSISESLAGRLRTSIVKQVVVKLKPSYVINEFIKFDKNTEIKPGELLCKYIESDDINSKLAGDFGNNLSDILSKEIASHYYGTLKDVFVHVKTNAKISKSIQKFIDYVNNYYNATQNTARFRTDSIIDNMEKVDHVIYYPVGQKSKVNSVSLYTDQILIEFFIEVPQPFSIGDKITFGNAALKGVCSTIRKDNERPYGAKTGRIIDASISPFSPMARMVYSFFINGYLTESMYKINEHIKEIVKKYDKK